MNKPIQIDPQESQPLDVDAFLEKTDKLSQEFEQEEKQRLQLEDATTEHWRDKNPNHFTASQRETTTILYEGLTLAHTVLQTAAYKGIGLNVEGLEMPDNKALQYGREFGNRGQCNPTYFTVGNLIKKLKSLQASGFSKEHIIKHYLFVAGGSCGPCRFGTYVTEYRKALRDSGFDGFRVLLIEQPSDGESAVKQATGEELGFQIDSKFFFAMSHSVIIGDVLNALGYRIRPYEINKGDTDKTLERAYERIAKAFETGKGMTRALWQTRKELKAIPVDKSQVKPRVAIIGEFWAMTTEGDGNYHMQRFLEQEGAEVDVQLAVAWPMYLLWCAKYDIKTREKLKGTDKGGENGSIFALEGVHVGKSLAQLWLGDKILRGLFCWYSKLLGLENYKLPDMDSIADIAHEFYDNNLRGGEGHMEVGKLIQNVVKKKSTMTLSIKPFGCMPSSAVSDGVQSMITERFPEAIFLPIETNGDGAVNVYSRVQMQLFKARQAAEKEMNDALEKLGVTYDQFQQKARQWRHAGNALHKSAHAGTTSAIDLAYELFG